MINRIYLPIKVNPEILVVVWRKVNMRNLEHSKRVSEANNSCGLYELFYLREYAWGYVLKTFHRKGYKEERSCSLLLEMLAHFSPHSPRAKSMAQGCFAVCGRRPWALPLDPTSIFEKLLDQKTSIY